MKYLLFILLLPLMGFVPHKFYVSNNIVEYNARTGNYEMICKLFTDDLQNAISPSKNLFLGDEREDTESNRLILEYLQKHFEIYLNDRKMDYRFIGKEVDPELTQVYLEFTFADNPSVIKIRNTTMFELFPEQKNIIDLRIHGWHYTMFLTKERPEEIQVR